jgi:hypothetical protein
MFSGRFATDLFRPRTSGQRVDFEATSKSLKNGRREPPPPLALNLSSSGLIKIFARAIFESSGLLISHSDPFGTGIEGGVP